MSCSNEIPRRLPRRGPAIHPSWKPVAVLVLTLAVGGAACSKDPQVAKREFVASGDAYMAEGKTAEAIIEYRNAIQQDPSYADARRKLADAYLGIGDRANGMGQIVRAADLSPRDAALQVRAGNLLLLSGQFEEARSRADKAIAIDSALVPALVLRANALAGLNQIDSAVAEMEAALIADPSRATAYAALGAMQMVRGSRTDAEAAFRKAVEVAPESSQTRLALANFYLVERRPAEAEKELVAAVSIDPKNTMAARALAYFYVGSGRAELAEPYLETVADRSTDATGKLALAAYYVSRNRPAEAKRVLEAVAAGPGEAATSAKLQLATIAFTAKDSATAVRLVDEVLSKEPSNSRALAARAELLAAEGRIDEAYAAVRKAADADNGSALAQYALARVQLLRHDQGAAEKALLEAVRLNPRMTPAKIELGQLQLDAGRVREAETQARAAVADVPQSPEARLLLARVQISRGSVADAEPVIRDLARQMENVPGVQTTLGMLELRRGNRAAARAAFTRAHALAPSHLEATSRLVALDIQERKPEAARARLDAALAASPDNADLLLLASSSMAAMGDLARAETLARTVVEKHPERLEAYMTLGRLYLLSKRLDKATEEYQGIAARQPQSVGALTIVGMLQQMQNKGPEARATFERVLAIDSTAPVAANNLAWIYVEEGGNLDVALQLAQTAKSRLPNEHAVNDTLGWVYYRKGLHALAVPALEQAVEQQPRNAAYLYHLGAAYAGAGDKEKARGTLQRAIAASGTSPEAVHARDLLQTLN